MIVRDRRHGLALFPSREPVSTETEAASRGPSDHSKTKAGPRSATSAFARVTALLVATGAFANPLPCAQRANDTPMASALSARDCYALGKRETIKERRKAHFAAGIAAAEAALARSPEDPDGLEWLAANLGAEALERGKLKALQVLPRMEELLLRLDALAPGHDGAVASRVLGHLYSTAPPVISIGSNKRARAAFEKALRLAPEHPGNQALAAEFFQAEGPKDRALELARKVLENPELERHLEAAEWRDIANEIVRVHNKDKSGRKT